MMPRDQAFRERALDPGGSFIVQAPAGSGKTELLTQRILALLGVVEHPGEILAITFTRKAASEMRHRLQQALDDPAGPPPAAPHARRTWDLAVAALARDHALGWNLRTTPSLLAIQTIDSFNAALVRRMPWLTRFGGVPQIAEDPRRLYRQAARRTIARVAVGERGAAAGARVLAHLDNRQDRLEELLVGMLQRRDQWLRHLAGRRVEEERGALEGALKAYVESRLDDCCRLLSDRLWARLAPMGCYAAGNVPPDHSLQRLAGLSERPPAGAEHLPIWLALADLLLTTSGTPRRRLDRNAGFPAGKEPVAVAMKAAMQDCLESAELVELAPCLHRLRRLPPPAYQAEQWASLEALVEVLLLAAAELHLVFAAAGQTDFTEVALRALAGLNTAEAPSELLLRLDAGIRHILVDEFQDTSHLQYRLLAILTAGWQPGDGRSLFLVGDPMQSIYRFREAEVGLFLQARREGIGNLRLEPLILTENFRSDPVLVDWFNATFNQVFPGQEDPVRGAVRYSPATAAKADSGVGGAEFLAGHERDDAGEAEQVLGLVRQALGRGESVAILVRARQHLAAILPRLRSAGLRYLAQDIDLLADRPVARDLVALTRALLHGGDRLAWLSVLRAPWCGLVLSDLEALVAGRPQATVSELLADRERLETLSVSGQARATRTFAVLQRARRQRGRLDLRRLVEGTWLALGAPACYQATDLEDAGEVFQLLARLDRGGEPESLDALEEGLQQLYAAPDAGAGEQLQVMTIHKAKGLEFDTVILPGLGRGGRNDDKPLLRWLDLPQEGLLLAPIPAADGSQDPVYQAITDLEHDRQALETVRLLYVAATRARQRLHLLGHHQPGADGTPRAPAGSLLEILWPVLGPRLEGVAAPVASSSPGEAVTIPAPLRRLPVDWIPPEFQSVPLPAAAVHLKPSARSEATLSSAGLKARSIGTVLHGLLERVGREGLQAWPPGRLALLEPEVLGRLRRLGVNAPDLPAALRRVLSGLQTALGGVNGRWVLQLREEAACELPLAGPQVSGVVDRTFVEGEIRWAIDYKTSEARPGESLEAFLAGEVASYREQLASYARLLRSLEPQREVRGGLYFPLFDGWCEVPL
jgi:ATP-dependent helicase/nuclease subunit A